MIGGMKSIVDISAWDIVVTKDGGIVVILPPTPRPRCIVVAADAIYLGTAAATMRLVRSAHLAAIVSSARSAVIAEADDLIRRETLVEIRTTSLAFGPIGEDNDRTTRRIAA